MKNNKISERLTVNQNRENQSIKREEGHKKKAQPAAFNRTNGHAHNDTPVGGQHIGRGDYTFQGSNQEVAGTKENEERNFHVLTRIINVLLVVGCVYIIFLIYGVAVTKYQYNDDGVVEAQRMSVSDIREQKAYEHIMSQYLQCRNLYEQTLMLDYRLGAGVEDPLVIAPEYEGLLETVEDLSIKTDAMTVDAGYEQLKSMMVSWIRDDIAVYLQNMSSAISQNNSETANNALQDKDRVYQNFSLITQNMVAVGEQTKGVDLTDLKEWTPEGYIDEEINGKKE